MSKTSEQTFKEYWKASKAKYKAMARYEYMNGIRTEPFAEGDHVYGVENGFGIVDIIDEHESFPIEVDFDNGSTDCFTPDGRAWFGGDIVLFKVPARS